MSDRFNQVRRALVREVADAAMAGQNVSGVFVVIQTRDGYFTAGGHHLHGLDQLDRLGGLGVQHMRAERGLGKDGSEYDVEDGPDGLPRYGARKRGW